MKIYLASPLGFAESTRAFMDELAARLREHATVLNPWDKTELGGLFGQCRTCPPTRNA